MIITNDANLGLIADRLGAGYTEADARTAIDNLLEAGWGGYDSIDIPEDIFFHAAQGTVDGPSED